MIVLSNKAALPTCSILQLSTPVAVNNRRKQMQHFLKATSCPKLHCTHPTITSCKLLEFSYEIIRMPIFYVVEKMAELSFHQGVFCYR